MTRRLPILAALAFAAVAPLACSPDAAGPTAPAMHTTVAFLKEDDAPFDLDGDGHLDDAEKDAKDAAEKAAKAAKAAAKKADKIAFEALRDQWRAYKDSVKKGLVDVEFVRCEPLPSDGETKKIGPKGGEIKMGGHKLVIPAGALSGEVLITGYAPTGARREVEFAPHGLQFNTAVRLVMNYDKCIVPDDADLQIVYSALGNKIVERQPSVADTDLKEVEAWTDHFSGYVVAYGRKTTTR